MTAQQNKNAEGVANSGESDTASSKPARPRLAVFKFASCDGCQLQLLSCEDEFFTIAEQLDIVYFLEATSRVEPGPYDIALIEGSISTKNDLRRIQQIREQSRYLITIGACATAGGIQSLRNWADHSSFLKSVYAQPEYIETLSTSTAIGEHVQVDFELRGCPINRFQLLEVIGSLLSGKKPRTPSHSVCLECKRQLNVCIAIAQKSPCLGPVTQAGCGALCPSYNRGCYGCFGPCGQANCHSLVEKYLGDRVSDQQLVPLLRSFNADAAEFRECGDQLDPESDPGVEL